VDARGTLRLLAALDTNVLVYAQGLHSEAEPKRQRIVDIIGAVPASSFVVPVQVLGELFNVLMRKARRGAGEARLVVRAWQDMFTVIPTTETIVSRGMDLANDHQLAIWDAVILAAASEAGCRLLLSEDMHDGFTWGGVTIVNPFAPTPNKLLDDLRSSVR
jgi:predicted nucleic acid-binding protein